jgi:hypothetical protein
MDIQTITSPLQLTIFGFGGIASNKDYAGTAFRLSGRMWEVIKTHGIKNEGKNIWVYEPGDYVFAGVEITAPVPGNMFGLEEKKIDLKKYAYYKHVGPYQLIKQAGQAMVSQLAAEGHVVTLPSIEIYGHWSADETKSETELIMSLQ